MSLEACADLVARGDPDRFACAMAAPICARAVLLPIYAFNVEVARAPYLTREPMIARIRLQWWRDVLGEIRAGGPVRRHEVASPLAEVLDDEATDGLERLVEAREWDIDGGGFDDRAALLGYLDATAGGLMWATARGLGAGGELEPIVRNAARASGLAAWFRAIPALEALGRRPLPDGRPGAVQALAREGLRCLAEARTSRHGLPRTVAPALYPVALSGPVLARAAADPMRVAEGTVAPSEARRRLTLARLSLSGRW